MLRIRNRESRRVPLAGSLGVSVRREQGGTEETKESGHTPSNRIRDVTREEAFDEQRSWLL